ncbi:hypothetical protein GEZ92_01210 [Streptococcus mitis]|nr:hypothetical protein [Streptococcus mitis]MQQ13097.1 hypothetical protein [Streptococcus mitis]MQQ44013.1 hypothetical protein [Streptococcus mitis]MQQ47314.1 hypothetical protein [Streptococcus mitis]MQQ57229.1 hypothetical protein [Streptococcus mitis]
MKKRNTLLILGVLLASVGLAACSSSMNTKGKGIAQLMNDNQERVFYLVSDSNDDDLPGKDEDINTVYITKSGKLKGYETRELKMDEVVGKNIDEVRKLAEEKSKETFEFDKVTAKVKTDSSGNNTTEEKIKIYKVQNNERYKFFKSLTYGQIRDKYYAGYNSGRDKSTRNSAQLLVTEVSKGNTINFDKADGKIVEEDK